MYTEVSRVGKLKKKTKLSSCCLNRPQQETILDVTLTELVPSLKIYYSD